MAVEVRRGQRAGQRQHAVLETHPDDPGAEADQPAQPDLVMSEERDRGGVMEERGECVLGTGKF